MSREFESLFETLSAPLLLYASQWLDAVEAEDIVQEAFVKLLDAWNSPRRKPRDVRPWLFRVVRNTALSRRRVRSRRAGRELRSLTAAPPWFECRGDELLEARAVERLVAELPEQEREVLVLRTWGDLTLQQVASVTGHSVPTVFRRHKAALERLRTAFLEEASCPPTPSKTTPGLTT